MPKMPSQNRGEAPMSNPQDFIFIQVGRIRLAAIGRLAIITVMVVAVVAGIWLGLR